MANPNKKKKITKTNPNNDFKINANKLGQRLNKQLRAAKQEFELREFENKSSDGLISVVVTGNREIKTLSIDHALVSEKMQLLESSLVSVLNFTLGEIKCANIKLNNDVRQSFYKEMGLSEEVVA